MDEEWRLEGMVDAHLEKTIIVLNLNISCGLPEIKCCILTWMELCCLTSELLFGNMIRFISLGICSDALSQGSLALIKVEALIGLSNFWDVCVSRHPYPYLCLKKNSSPSCLPDRCVWPFPWHWKMLKLVCVSTQANHPPVVKLS